LAYVVLSSICGYASTTLLILSILVVIIGSLVLSIWLSFGLFDAIFQGEEVPGFRDLTFYDRCTVRCRTASFGLLFTRTQVGLLVLYSLFVSPLIAVIVVLPVPMTGREWFSLPLFFVVALLTSCSPVLGALPAVFTLGFTGFPRVRGDRRGLSIALLSLGYCEAELITDGEVEVSGFRELGSYPVRYGEAPGDRPSSLKIRIGYFGPGPCGVEVRDCGFFFLRTRGVCVLHDARGLPEGRGKAFRLVRWWEKFSMVYAALCLEKGEPPEPGEVDELLEFVVNNRAGWDELVYLNRRFSMVDILMNYQVTAFKLESCTLCLVILVGGEPSLICTWWYLASMILLTLPVSVLMTLLVDLDTTLRSWRLVREGRVYESVLGSDPYDGEWVPGEGDPIASRHRESEPDDPQSG